MTILHILRPRGGCLSLIGLCLLLVLPRLSAQTAKELIADACYNELQQRKQSTLWASQVQRRTAGHIYLEEEIETVDGPIHRLLSADGHEPSPWERKQDDDRLHDLAQNPKTRLTLKKKHEADERKFTELLQVIPEVFLFEDQGNQGGQEKVAFRPNPAYNPKTHEERALHAMSGIILVNIEEKRLAELSATLIQQVDFGYGAIGRLNQGGTVNVTRTRLSPGIWKTSSSKLDINGRIIFFKTISKQQDETQSDFKLIAPDTTVEQALEKLAAK